MPMANRNTQWASIVVDELARAGLEAVCIAPGSRSTPLTVAFVEYPSIQAYSHLDERSAAFFALGLAKASNKPVALVCTSGTALANFYPAVIEAHYSQIPLLILSGDRPPELRYSGANQTIDQIKLFGDMVRWFAEVALPEAAAPAIAFRNLRTLMGRAFACANGLPKGVVHLNFPFRKPLEPIPVPADQHGLPPNAQTRSQQAPFTHLAAPHCLANPMETEWLCNLIAQYPKGLIVVGANPHHRETIDAIQAFAKQTGYPLLADGLSSLRFASAKPISAYETFLPLIEPDDPDVIIRIGKLPVSGALNDYLARVNCPYYVHLSEDGVWADDAHQVSHLIEGNITALLNTICANLDKRQPNEWAMAWSAIEQATQQVIDQYLTEDHFFEGGILSDTLQLLPDDSVVFVGNSLPVRHLDKYGLAQHKRLTIYANRGASGIDGLISTALGIGAAHPNQPLTLVIGDIAFYHDMNGLLAIQRLNIPITIVLLNNNGGGIFYRLPIRDFEPTFTEWFVTPHHLEFRHTAALYGLNYHEALTRQAFRQTFNTSLSPSKSTLIEVKTDAAIEEQHRQTINTLTKDRLRSISIWNKS